MTDSGFHAPAGTGLKYVMMNANSDSDGDALGNGEASGVGEDDALTTFEDVAKRFVACHRVRVQVLSLPRCIDRWNVAEAHARTTTLAHVPFFSGDDQNGLDGAANFVMGGGVDASVAKAALAESGVDGVERMLKCGVWRDWPVCDATDVARIISQQTQLDGVQDEDGDEDGGGELSSSQWLSLWKQYVGWFRRSWHARHVAPYTDFFGRHTTLGEVGSSLAHYEAAVAAAESECDVACIFEDDARPTRAALPALFAQIEALEARGLSWDLIYLASSKYDQAPEPEPPAQGASLIQGAAPLHLLVAGHRKVCAAYALSRTGAAKISRSPESFRQSVFAYDDFLPPLHSDHPRPDVNALPCVRTLREGDGGFLAFTFPDDAGLCSLGPEAAPKLSLNSRSPCVVGDHGVTCGEDSD